MRWTKDRNEQICARIDLNVDVRRLNLVTSGYCSRMWLLLEPGRQQGTGQRYGTGVDGWVNVSMSHESPEELERMWKEPRKRQQKKAAASALASAPTSPPTDYAKFPAGSDLPPRPGIFIASIPGLPRSSSFSRQKRQSAAQPQGAIPGPSSPQEKSLDRVLPPASDYRQSLIMPHLTRRFTLLRAPDGSLVSPEAMRAHLRAQRARARAANHATGSAAANQIDFLTEDEENEIIEQLKAQARAEGRDFDLERTTNAVTSDSWRNGFAAGTDGFGSWGPSSTHGSNKLSTLAESFGDFSSSAHGHSSTHGDTASSAWSPTRTAGGSSFTGRSTERDHAYFRTVGKERGTSRPDVSLPSPLRSGPAATSSQDIVLASLTAPSGSSEMKESPMPGAFAASEDGHTTQATSSTEQDHRRSDAMTFAAGAPPTQDSNLLTTLSPESFKRVSTALDEVFGLIASERRPSPSVPSKSAAESSQRRQRSSYDSDANSFTSAVSNVRALDTEHAKARVDDDGHDADRTLTDTLTGLNVHDPKANDAALVSPLPGPIPGSLPSTRQSGMPELPLLGPIPSLVASDSSQTIRDVGTDAEANSTGLAPLSNAGNAQYLSASPQSHSGSSLAQQSERSSVATARDAQSGPSRVVSTASTIGPSGVNSNDTSADRDVNHLYPVAEPPSTDRHPRDDAGSQLASTSSYRQQDLHADRTPEMKFAPSFVSPAQSALSRGDSVVSSGSVRSSLTGPSASHTGTHSRKSSADKLALARSMAPHPHLREQPSLSSIRRNFRQHNRSATGSSEGSLLGGHASRRSSGAMSPPPILSRSARSPNYFPPPTSSVSMHDYASGFKPPSAISPAAAAALQSMTSQVNTAPQLARISVMEASSALHSAQNTRNSASTGQSAASPHVPSLAAFASESDRAAATSSPETGATSTSLHQRNTSLSSNKQPPSADESWSPSTYVPRPAPLPASHFSHGGASPYEGNRNGLMPQPPSDPQQADRWRAVYGNKAADAASLLTSAEDVSADPNEHEDLWDKMASDSAPQAERPVSNLPSGLAEDRLAETGITFGEMAAFQDRLIQTANGAERVPSLPRFPADAPSHDQLQQQKFAKAKSQGLASPNMVFDAGSGWSKVGGNSDNASGSAFAGSKAGNIETSRDAPVRSSLASSVLQDPPVSPRAVMYDVTTSHRPTSPPLHSRNGSLNGLPSLLELNAPYGHRNRESISLSQAVDQASRLPRHPAFNAGLIAEDAESSQDQDAQHAVAPSSVQQHPFNVGYTSPPPVSGSLRSADSFAFARKPSSAAVGDSPRHQAQPYQPEDVWDRYGPQQGEATPDLHKTNMSPDSSFQGLDPSRLMDDIAAQTSAATRALKGVDDGSVATPPFRTKSISRKKSFKKVTKHISSPQLISTTQKLDNATQIPAPLETPSAPSRSAKWSNRSPGWGSIGPSGSEVAKKHAKTSPSGPSQMGSFGKSSLYFHRRRSSSFGHEASPNQSFGTPEGEIGATAAAAEPNSASDRAAGVHPNHPYINGGANGGSLSRLLSKVRSRKTEQSFGGATIEPFPPELSAAARASESSSTGQQQPPKTPELPSLPPVERSTPWTLPRMPPSPSSTDRGSSLRSPSSQYPLIDSTSLPRTRTKKRTPIVLKRESEVILPGDPGYIPTAIIGRSPEERARQIAEQRAQIDAPLTASQDSAMTTMTKAGLTEDSGLGRTTDTTLERPGAHMDYLHDGSLGGLAPPAETASQDDDEAATPRPASPMHAATAGIAVGVVGASIAAVGTAAVADKEPADGDQSIDDAADTTLSGPSQPQPLAEPAIEGTETADAPSTRSVDARKSLRDTIVRRTIIIPAGLDFGDQRRSLFGSSRKSRRFAGVGDEPVPHSGDTSKSFQSDSPAVIDDAALPAHQKYSNDDAEQRQKEEGIPTLSSNSTLHPDFGIDGSSRSNRASRVESSYAGSLYDMYIGSGANGEEVEFGSPGSDVAELPSAGRRSMATRASRMPETRRHIEVTERADGSVVWQVIAGLADRGSVYSDFDPRSSRHLSDTAASAVGGGGEHTVDGELLSGPPFRSPAGLTDDDSRSFFTRPRAAGGKATQQHPLAFTLDPNEPLPSLPHSAGQRVRQDVFEIANPVRPEAAKLDADPSSPSSTEPSAAASPTRIVYHNDAQLASLLDVLAKGKDSAKFQFHIGPHRSSMFNGGHLGAEQQEDGAQADEGPPRFVRKVNPQLSFHSESVTVSTFVDGVVEVLPLSPGMLRVRRSLTLLEELLQ
ncbi:hypothetical protein PHSY_000720 [Pseudozyma hubeiensis SY62]|uniref:Uncharacterized protein n=1 Tax=Pseudozyma hubeiensis (strain SY62) TaxID=1305764 RepID=R9NX93_PSEHS|nr:hypothetical protein PHSY_000720 [Pseudozyma hubeiensis SY62]GAC93157.1 hypothetical protein PHSY_000720 [Pseudozyma hubeiensis SY62]